MIDFQAVFYPFSLVSPSSVKLFIFISIFSTCFFHPWESCVAEKWCKYSIPFDSSRNIDFSSALSTISQPHMLSGVLVYTVNHPHVAYLLHSLPSSSHCLLACLTALLVIYIVCLLLSLLSSSHILSTGFVAFLLLIVSCPLRRPPLLTCDGHDTAEPRRVRFSHPLRGGRQRSRRPSWLSPRAQQLFTLRRGEKPTL